MKHLILLLFVCLATTTLSAQVKSQGLPAEPKAEEQAISVFPNPSSGIITISLEGFDGKKADLRIMNVIGNIVYREVLQDPNQRYVKTLDLNKLAKGLYYVKLETPTYSEVRKVIIR
ncbi:T9SS type A sorting domain-containing protein [Rufibacter sp. LB8]|uniref:T9SS type A sorting domain-containing protein n=1 Tax=Rufibacter sp. LB8 TaxID=2777781 RepID=UPI00178C4F69|nr:T9SS type A sorting domain-containing protein [Rufibacter sp. LB8]